MPMCERDRRALGLLGLAAKAGRLTVGVPLLCEALQRGAKGKVPLVIALASDASDNTTKRVSDRAAFYRVPLMRLAVSCAELAHAVGKQNAAVAAVGVTEPQLAAALVALMDSAD